MKKHAFIAVIVSFTLFFITLGVLPLSAAHVEYLKGGKIKGIVKDYIEANMPWPQGNIRVDFLGRIQDVSMQGEKISYKVKSIREEAYIGDSTFTVVIHDEGTLLREIPVRVRMEVAIDVVVSTKYLHRDSEIGNGDVKLVRKWFIQTPVHVMKQIEDVVGKRLYSDVMQNNEIKRNMLKSVKTIKRGKLVKVVLESGPMSIMTFGLCEEDGSRGDFIKVRNTSSNKSIYARVVDDSSVMIEY
ncbi:MAG TPA: flagella basal body P-ring formation protein FlgA [Syntrophaceae bacterium]|nr:flagella basal body P-ring formation protein FlgA [Syntrophaceae bacterium]